MSPHLLLPLLLAPPLAGSSGAGPETVQGAAAHRAPVAVALPSPVSDADFHDDGAPPPAQVELGRLLFYDKVLSGNLNISCATCHHSLTDTGDGLSLPVGEGGRGLGVMRDTGAGADRIVERVPRNAPPVFNLGAKELDVLFHDGRVAVDAQQPGGFLSPAGPDLPEGLDNVLAVQAMFPVTSAAEMAGQAGENPIADAAAAGVLAGPGGVWDQLALRLQAIPEYVTLFMAAYPGEVLSATDVTYVHAANAIAAFEGTAWRTTNSPFDRYLAGEKEALTKAARHGMKLFYGKAGCASCHSGPFQTDLEFHATCMPQIGPGKGDGAFGYEDYGRERVTGDPADRYRFRTPPLRNVELTGPWGHSGAYDTLEAVVRHQLDPVTALLAYDPSQAVLTPDPTLSPHDFEALFDADVVSDIVAANEMQAVTLTDEEVAALLDFLRALTDPAAHDLRSDVPWSVPSGLTVVE